jgi:hypothetical protein
MSPLFQSIPDIFIFLPSNIEEEVEEIEKHKKRIRKRDNE